MVSLNQIPTVEQVLAKLETFDNTEYNACMARINAKAAKKAADAAAKKAGVKKSQKEKKSTKSETVVTQTVKQVGAATVTATAIVGGSIPMEQLATGADVAKLQAVNAEAELLAAITNAALSQQGLDPASEEGDLVRQIVALFFADPEVQQKYAIMAATSDGAIDAEVLNADMQAFFADLEKNGHPAIEAGKALKAKRDAAAEKVTGKAGRKSAAKPAAATVIKSSEQAPSEFESAMTAAMKAAVAGSEKK